MADLTQVRIAKEHIRRHFGHLPEVIGIGITRRDEGYCVKINLSRVTPATRSIPRLCQGVPTVIDEIGEIVAQA